jgi:hypothetical protein
MKILSAWIDSVMSVGGNQNLHLALIIAFVIIAGLWIRIAFFSNLREQQGISAKKFEEYCRMYEAGQRDSDDEGFRRHIQKRQKHEEFLRCQGEQRMPWKS